MPIDLKTKSNNVQVSGEKIKGKKYNEPGGVDGKGPLKNYGNNNSNSILKEGAPGDLKKKCSGEGGKQNRTSGFLEKKNNFMYAPGVNPFDRPSNVPKGVNANTSFTPGPTTSPAPTPGGLGAYGSSFEHTPTATPINLPGQTPRPSNIPGGDFLNNGHSDVGYMRHSVEDTINMQRQYADEQRKMQIFTMEQSRNQAILDQLTNTMTAFAENIKKMSLIAAKQSKAGFDSMNQLV